MDIILHQRVVARSRAISLIFDVLPSAAVQGLASRRNAGHCPFTAAEGIRTIAESREYETGKGRRCSYGDPNWPWPERWLWHGCKMRRAVADMAFDSGLMAQRVRGLGRDADAFMLNLYFSERHFSPEANLKSPLLSSGNL